MPDTIASQQITASQCAVFKIDLKGRLVYIDEQTEDLFGLTCEELFGKSIYDFISSSSRRTLDQIIFNHKRYESFFQAIQLSYKLQDGKLHQIDTVITLSFIGGSPVNYQLILLPTQSIHENKSENIEKEFLKLLDKDVEEIELNRLAQLLCLAGEYTEAEFYSPNKRDQLVTIASYPERESGINAPAYIELFAIEPQERYSFNPDDKSVHEGFGLNRSESLQFLNYRDANDLVLRLIGPAKHQPSPSAVENLKLMIKLWNRNNLGADERNVVEQNFSFIGRVCDNLKIKLVITDDNFDVAYKNDAFGKWQEDVLNISSVNNLKEILSSFDIRNLDNKTIEFSETPFGRVVVDNSFASAQLNLEEKQPYLVMSTPLNINETNLYIHAALSLSHFNISSIEGGEFLLKSLAHDLRAPLISIGAFTQRLADKSSNFDDDQDLFTINCLQENVDILNGMIGGIEEISRQWNYSEDFTNVSIFKIINNQIDRLKVAYVDRVYKIEISDDIPECLAPKNQLNRLFGNLLENAFKYSSGNKNPKINIDYSFKDNAHSFSISDNGIGIPRGYLKKVFDPFFRNPDNIDIPGTGIGLSIAKRIVHSWNGEISIESEESCGSTVTFSLPIKESD